MGHPPEKSPIAKVFDAIASLWLSITLLSFLLLLTVLGTLEQTQSSLFEVQRKYFESLFLVHKFWGVPVPLPGVYLLLVLLTINLVCGGIVRIRKSTTTMGVIVAHVGIIVMFAGSAIEYTYSQKGHSTLAEGDSTLEFQSYFEWEIAIAEARDAGPVEEHVIPGERFMHLAPGARATFTSPTMPFDLDVHDVHANCAPGNPQAGTGPAVDGVALIELKRNKEAEADRAGVYVTVRPKSGGAPVEGILWAGERFPMSVEVDGRRWTLDFAHRRWQMPFEIRLEDFREQMHPGTGMAKSFESDVTKIENGAPQRVKISMNKPLREKGYTLYQSGFIAPSEGGGGRWWSTFSVVRNPADDVPLWSCIVITAGLLLHFSQKLVRHMRTQAGRRP